MNDQNHYIDFAREILQQGLDRRNEEAFRQRCQEIVQFYPGTRESLVQGLEYLEQKRYENLKLSFILSYLIYLESLKDTKHPLLAYSSYYLGFTSLKLNRDIRVYAIPPLKEAFGLFQKDGAPIKQQIDAIGRLAKAYRNLGEYKEAIHEYQRAIEMSKSNNQKEIWAFYMYRLGKMYANYLKQPLRGLNYIHKANKTLDGITETTDEIKRYRAICIDETGNIYRNDLHQYEKSIDFYQRAISINESLIVPNLAGKARNLSHMGLAYWELGKKEKGLQFLKEGAELTTRSGQERGIGVRYGQLGYMIAILKDPHQGIQLLHDAIQINTDYGDHRTHIDNLLTLSAIQIKINEFDQARNSLDSALSLANIHGYIDLVIDVCLPLGSLLCDYYNEYQEGYDLYTRAYNLHRESWGENIESLPDLEAIDDPSQLKLMYHSLLKKYHQESKSIFEQLNTALVKSYEQISPRGDAIFSHSEESPSHSEESPIEKYKRLALREKAKSILSEKFERKEYDVFLCHNSKDKHDVKILGWKLKRLAILPWLDDWELRPGDSWQTRLNDQIKHIKTAAVIVGKNGVGPWEDEELQAFLIEFKRRGCPVIPVLLPNAPKDVELPPLLSTHKCVDFHEWDPDPITQLVWGITGERDWEFLRYEDYVERFIRSDG